MSKHWREQTLEGRDISSLVPVLYNTHTHTHTHNHFTALWTLSGTTRVSWYQKVHFAIFRIFWCKMKITQADTPTIQLDCHPIQTNWCPNLCHPHHFYSGCPSWHNPPNLSWLGTGTKYAGLHTRWLLYDTSIYCIYMLCIFYMHINRPSHHCAVHIECLSGTLDIILWTHWYTLFCWVFSAWIGFVSVTLVSIIPMLMAMNIY